jgi:predicted Zn finger-like uncharacterized protein
MPATEARCPHCQARFLLPAEQLGMPAKCGRCRQPFTPTAAPPPAPAPVLAAPLPASAAPRPTLRPVVLHAQPVAAPPPAPARALRDDEEDGYDRPRRKARKPRPARSAQLHPAVIAGGLIGGGVLLVLVAVLVAYVFSSSSPAPAPRPLPGPALAEAPPPAARNMADTPGPGGSNNTSTAAPAPAGGGGAGVTAADTVRRVKGSTVYIRCDMGRNRLATGSGFFAGPAGYIVTNAHVIGLGPEKIDLPRRVQVVVDSGEASERRFEARLIGVDSEEDLALLWINGQNLPAPLRLGRSADLVETEDVFVFGYPLGEQLGMNISVNKTTVSSLRKERGQVVVVQVAGGMHPGNSGGPVTNAVGDVIGVSVAGIEGTLINFAIPAEITDRFVKDQVASGGKITLGRGLPPVSTKGKGR